MSRLQGKYALITGASQGLGLQMRRAFAREGAGRAIAARGAELLKEACDSIQTTAPKTKILAIAADVSQPQDIERVVATTSTSFRDISTSWSTMPLRSAFSMPFLLDYPLEDFRNVLNTNLIAPFCDQESATCHD